MAEQSTNNPLGYLSSLVPFASTGLDAISRGGPKRQFKWAKKMAQFQNKLNRENAEWVLAQNRMLSEEQRRYDSPASQMARFKEAGLNPHLAYSQGNVGNMGSPVSMSSLPAASGASIDTSYGNIGSDILRAELMQTQTGLTTQKIQESEQKTELAQAQTNLIKANPYMRPAYVDAMVKQLEATADLKAQEQEWSRSQSTPGRTTFEADQKWERGYQKMERELDVLFQRYKLFEVDQQVKARIIEGKDWENDLKEIQSRWMKDAEITPQHIYQGLMMLLMKLR